MAGRDRVFSVSPARGAHGVEGGHAVADVEAVNGGADSMDGAGDVVARVEGVVLLGQMPPVFDIGTSCDNLYQEFMGAGVGDGDGVDGGGDCGKRVNDSFKHCGHCETMLGREVWNCS